MTPDAIAALVLTMKPRGNKIIWMLKKAAELGMMSVYTQMFNKSNWK